MLPEAQAHRIVIIIILSSLKRPAFVHFKLEIRIYIKECAHVLYCHDECPLVLPDLFPFRQCLTHFFSFNEIEDHIARLHH